MLGTHRGEPFYARSAVSVLHTADRWRREGREVSAGEALLSQACHAPPPICSPFHGLLILSYLKSNTILHVVHAPLHPLSACK